MKRTQNKASEFTLSLREVQAIINAAGKPDLTRLRRDPVRDRVLVKTLYYCALRVSEAASLDVRDIDFERETITVTGKGDKQRTIPAPPDLLNELYPLIAGRHGPRWGPVFLSRQGGPLSRQQINLILARAAKEAGVKNPHPDRKHVNPHLLRHSFARHWLDRGGDLRALSHILGHQSVATTADTYGTPSQAFVKKEYEKMTRGED